MTQQIIRIDKGDGSEEVVDRESVEHVVRLSYRRPDEVMAEFDAGHRIASSFAYYEIRELPEAA